MSGLTCLSFLGRSVALLREYVRSVAAHTCYHSPLKVEAGGSPVAYLLRPHLNKYKVHEGHKMDDVLAVMWNNFSTPESFSQASSLSLEGSDALKPILMDQLNLSPILSK